MFIVKQVLYDDQPVFGILCMITIIPYRYLNTLHSWDIRLHREKASSFYWTDGITLATGLDSFSYRKQVCILLYVLLTQSVNHSLTHSLTL